MIGPQFPEEVPSRVPERTLREFGGLCLAMAAGLSAVSWYRHQHGSSGLAWVPVSLAVLVGIAGLLRPNAIRPVYLTAMALTKPIGHVTGVVLLAIVYYVVLTPIALAFRRTGRDALGRRHWGAQSYWVDRMPTADVRDYLRQYQRQVVDHTPYASGAAPCDPAPVRARSPVPQSVVDLPDHHSLVAPGAHRESV
jgi:Saxitoxin biosynthesis operon protein SxtJ